MSCFVIITSLFVKYVSEADKIKCTLNNCSFLFFQIDNPEELEKNRSSKPWKSRRASPHIKIKAYKRC